jgi:hypothetical protein
MPDPLARLTAALAERYTVEREIGRGGMATVYLARDVKHDRPEEVVSTSQAQVMTVPRRPGPMEGVRTLGTGTADVQQVAISDDGTWVAINRDVSGNQTRSTRTSRHRQIDVVPYGGGATRTLGPASVSQFLPRWAPDNTHRAVLRADTAGDFLTLISVIDGAARRLGSRPAAPAIVSWGEAAWSADGARVAYLTAGNEVVVVDSQRLTETVVPIPDSVGTVMQGLVLSPHGDSVVVGTLRRPTDWAEVWLVSLVTQDWTRVVAPFGNSAPMRWLPDGTIYVANDRALAGESGRLLQELWAIRADGARPRFLADLPDGCEYPTISADGRRLACDVHRDVSDLLAATDFAPGGR